MSIKPIVTGILSFGMSGKVFHAPFVEMNKRFVFRAVVERSRKVANEYYPHVISYDAVDDLINDPSIELVIVNTPNQTHYTYAKQALLAGKDVLVEKPCAGNSQEVAALFDLAAAQGRHCMVYQNRRWDSDFKSVKKIIQSGVLGELIEFHVRFDRYRLEKSAKLFKEVRQEAAGLSYDLGPHMLDQVISLFGKPVKAIKITSSHRPDSEVDDYFNYVLSYPEGLSVYVTGSLLVARPLPAYVVHGVKGSFHKSRADVQEFQLQQGILPGSANYGVEAAGEEGLLAVVDEKGDKLLSFEEGLKGNYDALFNAVYDQIRLDKPYPITAQHVLWQMEETTDDIRHLFSRYLNALCTREEYDRFLKLVADAENDAQLRSLLDKLWLEMAAYDENAAIPLPKLIESRKASYTGIRSLYRIAAAAVVLMAIGLGIYFYIADGDTDGRGITHYTPTDVEPGGNKAVLTLADGRKITLDDAANGQLAEESGIRITKTEDGQIVYEVTEARIADARQRTNDKNDTFNSPLSTFNSITTPRGGQYKVILPDGSTVWLNAASSLRYPTSFVGEERKVELKGEAFFAIVGAQNLTPLRKEHIPFIVATATQEVTVLGTQFNVNAYSDEPLVKTTLVEGSVAVRSAAPRHPPVGGQVLDHRVLGGEISSRVRNDNNSQQQPSNGASLQLVPNEQSTLQGNKLTKRTVDIEEVIAWKQGTFLFNDTDLHSVLRQIGRWYDVEVDYTDVPNRQITAIISRKVKLSAVIQSLEATSGIKLTIKERRIMVR